MFDPGQLTESGDYPFDEPLTRVDASGQVHPFLLASVPQQVSPTQWVLTLRPHITFQDGHPLDGAALAASLTRQEQKNPIAQANIPGGVFTATGPLQVTVTTTNPQRLLPYNLSDPSFAVYDAAVVEAAPDGGPGLVGKGAFTAPYALTRSDSRGLTFTAYDGYWQGRPALASIEVTYVASDLARVAAVESGQVDFGNYANTPNVRRVIAGRNDALLKLSAVPGDSIPLYYNTVDGPFADPQLRRAVALTLNYGDLAKSFSGGVGVVAHGLFPDAFQYTVRNQKTDAAAAGALLDAAGWVRSASGTRKKGGQSLTAKLLIYPERPNFTPTSLGIQSELGALGITVDIITEPYDDHMYDDLTKWDMALYDNYSVSATGAPDSYLEEYLLTGGGLNFGKISDPNLDSLLKQLQFAPDDSQRGMLLTQIQNLVYQQAYYTIVYFAQDGVLVSPKYKSYVADQSGGVSGYFSALWNWQTAPG